MNGELSITIFMQMLPKYLYSRITIPSFYKKMKGPLQVMVSNCDASVQQEAARTAAQSVAREAADAAARALAAARPAARSHPRRKGNPLYSRGMQSDRSRPDTCLPRTESSCRCTASSMSVATRRTRRRQRHRPRAQRGPRLRTPSDDCFRHTLWTTRSSSKS